MSFVAVAVGAAVVGSAVYSADQQRKAAHRQQDALKAAQEEDARKAAEAETAAGVAANAERAANKRRRGATALGGSGTLDETSLTLGGPPTALALGRSGAFAPAARAAAYAAGAGSSSGTALGAGASTARSLPSYKRAQMEP